MEDNIIEVDSIAEYDIGAREGEEFDRTEPLPDDAQISKKANVIITGRAPIWRYLMAYDNIMKKKPQIVACYSPKDGNVIVFPEKDRGKLLIKKAINS